VGGIWHFYAVKSHGLYFICIAPPPLPPSLSLQYHTWDKRSRSDPISTPRGPAGGRGRKSSIYIAIKCAACIPGRIRPLGGLPACSQAIQAVFTLFATPYTVVKRQSHKISNFFRQTLDSLKGTHFRDLETHTCFPVGKTDLQSSF
jgi:hypothetical protein